MSHSHEILSEVQYLDLHPNTAVIGYGVDTTSMLKEPGSVLRMPFGRES